METREIRRLNLIGLIGDQTQAKLGALWEIKPSMLSNYVTGDRGIGPKIARKIESKENLPTGWMDVPHTNGQDSEVPAGMHFPPVVGDVRGGPDGIYCELEYATGQGEGFVRYPVRDPNGYALRVKGDSMRPRIRPGEFLIVAPNSTPIVNDEAVIKTKDGRVMVKLYTAPRNGMIELHSVNHEHKPITLYVNEIEYIHYVISIAKAEAYYPNAPM